MYIDTKYWICQMDHNIYTNSTQKIIISFAIMHVSCSSPKLIAFTTPENYSHRLLSKLLLTSTPLPLPTISITPTPQHICHLLRRHPSHRHFFQHFAGIAFTSRTGISAFFDAFEDDKIHWGPPQSLPLVNDDVDSFVLAALGEDAQLLLESGVAARICPEDPTRIRVSVPEVASPTAMVKALGYGHGKRILCPTPAVIDLTEPPVVPNFIKDLEANGWIPEKVQAYETKWMGPKCAEKLVNLEQKLDAIIFTSTAEVEGLIKSLNEIGWSWEMVKKRWPDIIIASHGPVTAKGAEKFGVFVDVVSEHFSSFQGVLDALQMRWKIKEC